MRKLVYITGVKGAGKDTVATELLTAFPELKVVETFTTRAPRHAGERGHIFIPDDKFERLVSRGRIDVSAQAPGEEYKIGVSFSALDELISAGGVPLVTTRTPEILQAIQSKYPDSFGIMLNVGPVTALDHSMARQDFIEFPESSLKSLMQARQLGEQLRRIHSQNRRGLTLRVDDMITDRERAALSLQDAPPKDIAAKIKLYLRDYLQQK